MPYTRGTQSEAARREGVHRSTVSRRVHSGKPTPDVDRVDNARRTEQNIQDMKRQMGAGSQGTPGTPGTNE